MNIRDFLDCGLKYLALGRLANDFEECEGTLKNGETKTKLVKASTKLKAGREEREGEGRMLHRADVLKHRKWALNGRTLRWPDKTTYQAGTEVP